MEPMTVRASWEHDDNEVRAFAIVVISLALTVFTQLVDLRYNNSADHGQGAPGG